MELGFETIGNATLICYDRTPVLVTDPWIVVSGQINIRLRLMPMEVGFTSKRCELLPAFIRYDCVTKNFTEINPKKNPATIIDPRYSEMIGRNGSIGMTSAK